MKNTILAAGLAAGFLLFALFAQAPNARADAGDAPMQKPPEVVGYIHAKTPYGQATLHKLFMKIYDSALWTDSKTWSMAQVFALSIRYDMNFTTKELTDRSFDEMARVAPFSTADRASLGAELEKALHDVHPGDTITAVYLPKKGAVLYYNGTKTGQLRDTGFAQKFLNIWLGPQTSEPEVRRQLLAGK